MIQLTGIISVKKELNYGQEINLEIIYLILLDFHRFKKCNWYFYDKIFYFIRYNTNIFLFL